LPHLFSPEGDHALDAIVPHHPLLALDFDGTVAPIVALPEMARAPVAISRVLERISHILPVAVVTGRAVADVSRRLGFTPLHIIGNHGAEGLPEGELPSTAATVAHWHAALQHGFGADFETAGVVMEDKGHSLSLHYRLARDRKLAMRVIDAAVASLAPRPQIIGGKCVTNLLLRGAPNKFDAVQALSHITGRDAVIFVGDDLTDDIVFAQAPPDWLTIRIEALEHHRARFHLNHQNEVAMFLQRLLRSIERHAELGARHAQAPRS
jgi:trehalose 6-phosphate phosphatase